LLSFQLFAQTQPNSSDEQLAAQYYQNKEFDKAAIYYERLFNKNNQPLYYAYYLHCLIETQDFKKAEKIAKKQLKQQPEHLSFMVDLGVIYAKAGESKKQQEQFKKAIQTLSSNQEEVINLAQAFLAIQEFDNAIAVYQKGKKLLQNNYAFNFELAEVYATKGNIIGMLTQYFELLEMNDSYIQNVENALQTLLFNKADSTNNALVKKELLKRIQKSADKPVFEELLIWILLQEKDFEAAFLQIKAIDKRNKENGARIMAFAQLCLSNENYDIAIKTYQYILTKGAGNYNYHTAQIEILNVQFKKVESQINNPSNDLISLEKNYRNTIDELGKTPSTLILIKNLAHLQAFYMGNTNSAIKLLEEAITIPQISTIEQATCKLELGDILLMTGDIWEASLNYSQVEKTFKYDAIGQEAKFRNAKIAYYTGNFKWAQAQLDVLKGATSKLIANDALNLSLFITDNIGIDSNTTPLTLFSQAELLAFQNKNQQTLLLLDSILSLFPTNELVDDILFKQAQILIKQAKYQAASVLLEKIITQYSSSLIADDALFQLATLNETQLSNNERAKTLYQEILTKYPGSLYTVEARKRFRFLRKDIIN